MTIAIDGDAEVGRALRARVSKDLEGAIVSWSWERYGVLVDWCSPIRGADAPVYYPVERDAWQILRLVVVAELPDSGAERIGEFVGPVVNPNPEAFSERLTLGDRTGTVLAVAPGVASVVVDAECPVTIDFSISTPRVSGTPGTAIVHAEDIVGTHELVLDSQGGELAVLATASAGWKS